MKRNGIIILCAFIVLLAQGVRAQSENKAFVSTVSDAVGEQTSMPVPQGDEGDERIIADYDTGGLADAVRPKGNDSVTLNLPLLNSYGQPYINSYPLDWGGWYSWDLHRGLNINLNASVFATLGNGACKGVGFGQNISAMYAMPLTGKMSLAVGGYFNNVTWAHRSYRDAGLNAVLGYRFDEHWEAYVYGQKSLVDRPLPMPLYDMGRLGDRIGAAVRYNFNPSMSIQVSVEYGNERHAMPRMWSDYDNDMPVR